MLGTHLLSVGAHRSCTYAFACAALVSAAASVFLSPVVLAFELLHGTVPCGLLKSHLIEFVNNALQNMMCYQLNPISSGRIVNVMKFKSLW